MAGKKVGDLIKEARTNAGLSQEKLAAGIDGLSASDISKAERNEKDLTQAQLKEIAKATKVTQKSLLEAASSGSTSAKTGSSSGAKKTGTAAKKNSTASTKKTGTTAKKSGTSTAKKTSSASGTSIKVTATEKKLVELYRAADSDTKKAAIALLKGEKAQTGGILDAILDNTSIMDAISGFFTKE